MVAVRGGLNDARKPRKWPPRACTSRVGGSSLVGLALLPPISQDQNYHHFADQQTILGMPRFWNVVSNSRSLRSAWPGDLFNRLDLEPAYIEAYCCHGRVFRNSEMFSKAAADPGVLISVSASPSISIG